MPVTIQPFVCGFQVVMNVTASGHRRVTPDELRLGGLRPFLSLFVVDTAVIGVVSAVTLDH